MENNELNVSENTEAVETKQKKHQYHKSSRKNSWWSKFVAWIKAPSSDFVLFVILLVLLNLVGMRAFARFDLTETKAYSLSNASKEVVKTIEQPLSIKVFFSNNLPPAVSSVDQYVRDILVEYSNAANSNFSYEFFNLDKPENVKTAENYGLQQFQIQEVKENDVGFKNVFMGLVITYADQIEKIDGITSTKGFEYQLTTTISKIVSSANVFTGLTGNVVLTLYKSSPLDKFNIQGIGQVEEAVKNAYETVNKKNFGRIDFQTISPSSAEVAPLVEKYGIQSINWKGQDGTVNFGALGLVLEYNDNFRLIPLKMVNMIFTNGITGLEELEDNITTGLQSLIAHTSSIGYLIGNGELDLNDSKSGAANFKSILEDMYTLNELNLDEADIPSDMQCIIVNGPKTAFSETAIYKLDQFIMKGGNVMFFMDSFEEQMQQTPYGNYPQYNPIRTGLEKLFSKYGFEFGTNVVFDENCFWRNDRSQGKLMFYHAPILTGKSLDSKHPVTSFLNNVIFLQSSSIDASKAAEDNDIKLTTLVKSSPKSWTESSDFIIYPGYMTPPADKSTEKAETLAVMLEGKFESAFTEAPAVEEDEDETEKADSEFTLNSHVSKSLQNGKIFAAGTSFITSPQILSPNSNEPVSMFIRNAVDYMNGNEDLCTMRSKDLGMNTLEVTNGKATVVFKYLNEFGLAFLVGIAGLIVLLLRKKHRKEIRMKYDPSDSREMSNRNEE